MEGIQNVIAEIEEKINKMRTSLEEVKTENSALKSEIQIFKEKLSQREQEAQEFQQKYDDLVRQQADNKEVKQDFSVEKEAEIDALVREIDDCINRLKA